MRGWLFKLGLALCLGVVVNLGVAWFVWSRMSSPPWSLREAADREVPIDDSDRELWARRARDSWPTNPPSIRSEQRHSSVSGRLISKVDFEGDGVFWVWRLEAGWPYACLAIEYWRESLSVRVAGQGPIENNGWTIGGRPFPKEILWTGFAVNTAAYTLGWLVLILSPGVIRRRARVWRSRCPACGYPVGLNPVCTECGKRLPARLAASHGESQTA